MSEPSPARPDSQPPGHGAATGLRRSRRRLELYTVYSYDATLVLVLLSAVLAVWARYVWLNERVPRVQVDPRPSS